VIATIEGLPALRTLIGLLTRVDSLMLNEAWAPAEGLPAFLALMGLLTGVNLLVLS
jgi:hypothetical protein